MTLGDANCRAKQLNAQANQKSQEERIKKNQMTDLGRKKRNDSVLPIEFVHEFEKRFIRVRDSETENGKRKKSRALIVWGAAQRMVVSIQVEPSEWFFIPMKFMIIFLKPNMASDIFMLF